MAEELQELAAEYAASTGLSVTVCLDLLKADLEPPLRGRVDDIGFTPKEIAACLAGQKARKSEQDAEEDGC